MADLRLAAAAAATALAALLAAGCGGGGQHAAVSHRHACFISRRLRHDIAAAKREIVLMHKLDEPLKTVHAVGPTKLEYAVNRFLLDVGPLPVNVKGSRLMDLGKSAVGLCHDCFNAIEAEEPTVQTRFGRSPCAGR